MNSAVAELQAIQSAQDENGKISAESLSNVINTLSGAAGSASQVDTSFAAGYSDQVSQLGVVNGEIDAVQGELGDALSQLNSKTEDIKSSVQTLTGAAATLNQLADGLTSGATEMSNGAAEMGSGATEMGTAATTMGAVAGQLPTDMISQLSAVTQQLYAGATAVNTGTKTISAGLRNWKLVRQLSRKQPPESKL